MNWGDLLLAVLCFFAGWGGNDLWGRVRKRA